MKENIIAVFCLVYDLLRAMGIEDDFRTKICNAVKVVR